MCVTSNSDMSSMHGTVVGVGEVSGLLFFPFPFPLDWVWEVEGHWLPCWLPAVPCGLPCRLWSSSPSSSSSALTPGCTPGNCKDNIQVEAIARINEWDWLKRFEHMYWSNGLHFLSYLVCVAVVLLRWMCGRRNLYRSKIFWSVYDNVNAGAPDLRFANFTNLVRMLRKCASTWATVTYK